MSTKFQNYLQSFQFNNLLIILSSYIIMKLGLILLNLILLVNLFKFIILLELLEGQIVYFNSYLSNIEET